MARKTGLGRGLGAIFGTDVVESVEESLHQPEKKEENHVSRETTYKNKLFFRILAANTKPQANESFLIQQFF